MHAPQDLEILRGYVPGYDAVLGHEFVGTVADCSSRPELVGQRVVGEINCRCDPDYSHADPIFLRNHAPQRTVLGIIGKDVGTYSISGSRRFLAACAYCLQVPMTDVLRLPILCCATAVCARTGNDASLNEGMPCTGTAGDHGRVPYTAG